MPSARQVNWAKIRITLVALAALAILGELAYLLAGGTVFEPQGTVYLYISDATGLVKGAPMAVDGVPAGKVTSIALTGLKEPLRVIRVTLRVQSDRLRQIPSDSVAEINPDNLVGDMFVDVTSGHSPKPLHPGSEMIFKPQEDFVKTVDLTQFDHVLKSIDAVLTDIEQGKSRVGQLFMDEAIYNDLLKRVTEALRGLRAATSATAGFGKAIETDEAYRKLSDPLVELEQSLERLQQQRAGAGAFLNDSSGYDQLWKAAADLRTSVAQARASSLFTSDQPYQAWKSGVQRLIDSVDHAAAGPLFNDPKTYQELESAAHQMRDNVKDFRENPKKYLRMKVF
ncbi:MAG TPA: MlaD family protein [Bryobacteraceae bacterium]|nr:MlaD family protein [Bryobacteraceae bacterium]